MRCCTLTGSKSCCSRRIGIRKPTSSPLVLSDRVGTMTTFSTSRDIPASAEDIFAAFSDRERLARWWGPNGFTNTFHAFEFKPGGRWSLTMHSPNGGNPANEIVFETIEPPRKIVIRHLSLPLYRLT